VIVLFIAIDGIADHHCLNYIFILIIFVAYIFLWFSLVQ